jgi:hypothetical protein
MSKIYLSKAIKEAKKYKKDDVLTSSIEKLLIIAVHNKATVDVDDLKSQLFEILTLNLLSVNNSIIFEFIRYYNNLGDTETINDIVTFTKSLYTK